MLIGASLSDSVYIGVALLTRPLLRRIGVRDYPCTFRIKINQQIFAVTLSGSHEEFLIFYEILVAEEYKIDAPIGTVKTIIDAGANIGLVSIYYAAMFPEATVYAFEPNPQIFPRLIAHTANCHRIKVFPLALGGESNTVTFYVNEHKSIASSLIKRDDMELVPYQVEVTTIDDAMTKMNITAIDILQFDVEGAEYDMFKSSRLAQNAKYLIGEVHEDLMNVAVAQVVAIFSQHKTDLQPGRKSGRYTMRSVRQ